HDLVYRRANRAAKSIQELRDLTRDRRQGPDRRGAHFARAGTDELALRLADAFVRERRSGVPRRRWHPRALRRTPRPAPRPPGGGGWRAGFSTRVKARPGPLVATRRECYAERVIGKSRFALPPPASSFPSPTDTRASRFAATILSVEACVLSGCNPSPPPARA